MSDSEHPEVRSAPLCRSGLGPTTLAGVMEAVNLQVSSGESRRLRPLATGFSPLDELINGGLRPGELMMLGGASGVGKTIWALQVARNVVRADPTASALYICYEHDGPDLMSRLMCLESAELGQRSDALTLRKLSELTLNAPVGAGLSDVLRRMPRYADVLTTMSGYAGRLILACASGTRTTLGQVREWAEEAASRSPRLLVVVDYLQKIPVEYSALELEAEATTYLAQGLKELAMALQVGVLAIAASDREGLKSRRMRLADLRGSSAMQYEADIGIVLHNKYQILSREHMVYNPGQAETMRNWLVMSIEKNRAGANAVDMEYALDASHFRVVTNGGLVRERLVDDKLTRE